MEILITCAVGLLILFLVAQILSHVVWALRYPFLFTNWLQWFLACPVQHLLRNQRSCLPRFAFMTFAPLRIAYGVAAYVMLTPVRLVNAIYFDLLLFWSVTMRDGLADLFAPRHAIYRNRAGLTYGFLWLLLSPLRVLKVAWKYPVAIVQGIAMTCFDVAWPTLTLFHGTSFEHAATNIAHTGVWYVGTGSFAGSGIYFGLRGAVAKHYARHAPGTPAIVVGRVTLSVCRPIATLPAHVRSQFGPSGAPISQAVRFPFASVEYWRSDRRWFEFCIAYPRTRTYVNSWRVRPICLVDTNSGAPLRVYGGLRVWPANARGWAIVIATFAAYYFLGLALAT